MDNKINKLFAKKKVNAVMIDGEMVIYDDIKFNLNQHNEGFETKYFIAPNSIISVKCDDGFNKRQKYIDYLRETYNFRIYRESREYIAFNINLTTNEQLKDKYHQYKYLNNRVKKIYFDDLLMFQNKNNKIELYVTVEYGGKEFQLELINKLKQNMGQIKERKIGKMNEIKDMDEFDKGIYEMDAVAKEEIKDSVYKRLPVEPMEIIRRAKLPYEEGNVLKYLLRFKYKNGKEDLLKAKRYIDYIIERDYANETTR